MKSILVSILVHTMRAYVGTGPYDRIKALVVGFEATDYSSAERRKLVVSMAKNEFTIASTALIDAIIGVVLIAERRVL